MVDSQDPVAPQGPSEDDILAALESGKVPPLSLDPEASEAEHENAINQAREELGFGKDVEQPPDEGAQEPQESAQEAGERLAQESADEGERLTEEASQGDAADAYEKALVAMRRYKTPDKVIDAMSREEAIAYGSHLAKIQGDFDRANTDLRALKQGQQRSDGGEKAEEATRQVEAPPAPDLEAVQTQAAELLGLSKEEGAVLGKLFQAVTEPLKRELAERDTRDQLRDNLLGQVMLQQSRGRLLERFPQVADDKVFDGLVSKAVGLVKAKAADNLPSALEVAARAAFYDEHQRALASTEDSKANTKARAAVSPPSRRTPPAALSHDQRLDKVLEMLESGASPGEAASAAGW